MDINVSTVNGVTVVGLSGELDAGTAQVAQQQILPHVVSGGKLLLDMSGVGYMSSAGLRLLLSTYRQASAGGSKLMMVGLSEELKDTMSMTGFLSFFKTSETIDSGLAAMAD